MAIWALYTECESRPDFQGYTTSKKKAKEWMMAILEQDYNGGRNHEFSDVNETMHISVWGKESHQHILAERLVKIW